jgi:pimeloyl-ACP methyl ester carboxylesterase
MTWAPNHGRAAEIDRAWGSSTVPTGFDELFRVPVGPPEAALAVGILNPANHAPGRSAGTILVLHGVRSSKEAMLGVGHALAADGFRAVLVDLRGHGQSTGDYLTFGAIESRDLSQVLDHLAARGLLENDVGAYGTSYGAAIAIQLAGHDTRLKTVVAVAPFSSLRDVIPDYASVYLPGGFLLPRWWLDRVVDQGGALAGFDPDDAAPVRAVAHTNARILIFHGRADAHIPLRHSEMIRHAAPARVQLRVLDSEDHVTIMHDRDGTIMREAVAWSGQEHSSIDRLE